MKRQTIKIPEGYNGHTYKYYAEPLVDNGNSVVILQCAEPGKEYMRRWVHRSTFEAAKEAVNYQPCIDASDL